MWTIDVPGSLSNLGPGFDVLGMAVELRNTWQLAPRASWQVGGRDVEPSSHLVFSTLLEAADAFGVPVDGAASLTADCPVPQARGLGSSATARVAGLEAWKALTGANPSIDDQLAFLAAGEGHPDNVAPCLLGGWTMALMDGAAVHHRRFDPAPGMRIALCIPEVEVSTAAARAALPEALAHGDAVYSSSRVAFLIHGLVYGDADALALGTQDRLHHPYRAALIGPVDVALDAARASGAAAAFISGSGSTLAALVLDSTVDAMDVAKSMAAPFSAAGIETHCRAVVPATEGARTRRAL